MAAPELGEWEPLTLVETLDVFKGASFRWWISGGRALELHVGRSWRGHSDADLGVMRDDLVELEAYLTGWDLWIAAAGELHPCAGAALRVDRQENNVWCRRDPNSAWSLDVTVAEGDDTSWIYRRDPSVRVEWEQAVLTTPQWVPYLAPELQLLFKSRDHRAKDDLDAAQVIPDLDSDRCARLAGLLLTSDPWQRLIGASQ